MGGSGGGGAADFYNDVWCSENGSTWNRTTASAGWSPRRLHTSVVYDEKMWVIGGYSFPANHYKDVWYSSDGVNWNLATGTPPWAARSGHASVVHNGKMWVLGGFTATGQQNDVWSSTDGEFWTPGPSASWSKRYEHTAVAFQGKIWVIGGDGRTRDVWSSPDGVNWTMVTDSAAWEGRGDHTSVVFNDKMWVIGGAHGGPTDFLNDAWYSMDGAVWMLASAEGPWIGRYELPSVVHRGAIWLLGGHSESLYTGYLNDVWYMVPQVQLEGNYFYDDVNHLQKAMFENGRRILYTYDPAGNRTGKTVTSQVLASLGPSNGPIADVTASQTGVGMLQLRVTVDESEDIVLSQIRFEGAGTGNELDHLSGASLYLDTDHNGLLSAADIPLATNKQFNVDDGFLSFDSFSRVLGGDSDHDLLITYDLNGTASNGDSFALSWAQNSHIEITGASSGNTLLPLGAPIYGATKTVQGVASTPLPTNTSTDTPTVTPTATATWTPTPTNIPPTPPPNTPSPPDLATGVLDVSPALSLPVASDDDGFIVDYFFVLWREEPGPQGTPTVADYRSGFAGRPTPVFQPSEALIRGTTYYWRARAFDDDGDPSVYTALFRFQLATETPTRTATPPSGIERWRQY